MANVLRRWEKLATIDFGHGKLFLVAWRTSQGHLTYAGLVHSPADSGGIPIFPRMIFGGGPGCWKECKKALSKIASLDENTLLQLSWSVQVNSVNTLDALDELIASSRKEAHQRWGT